MRLPGMPAAVAIFHPLQFYLAGALLARHPRAELWYGEPAPEDIGPHEQLHAAAAKRAALTFPATTDLDITPLRLRMAELGILTGSPSARAA